MFVTQSSFRTLRFEAKKCGWTVAKCDYRKSRIRRYIEPGWPTPKNALVLNTGEFATQAGSSNALCHERGSQGFHPGCGTGQAEPFGLGDLIQWAERQVR